jgi:transcriptional/translational regulatory protein YebC/TACO1
VEEAGVECEAAEVTWLPTLTTLVSENDAATVQKLVDLLDDHDDVREVYSNADMPTAEG